MTHMGNGKQRQAKEFVSQIKTRPPKAQACRSKGPKEQAPHVLRSVRWEHLLPEAEVRCQHQLKSLPPSLQSGK